MEVTNFGTNRDGIRLLKAEQRAIAARWRCNGGRYAVENDAMIRTCLAVVTAVTLLSGTAMAETMTTTTTETTAPYIAPVSAFIDPTTTERTVEQDRNGVVRSQTTITGTAVNPLGE